jgi:hypothetical protein
VLCLQGSSGIYNHRCANARTVLDACSPLQSSAASQQSWRWQARPGARASVHPSTSSPLPRLELHPRDRSSKVANRNIDVDQSTSGTPPGLLATAPWPTTVWRPSMPRSWIGAALGRWKCSPSIASSRTKPRSDMTSRLALSWIAAMPSDVFHKGEGSMARSIARRSVTVSVF